MLCEREELDLDALEDLWGAIIEETIDIDNEDIIAEEDVVAR